MRYECRLRRSVGRSRTRKTDQNFQGNRADAFRFPKLHWIARKRRFSLLAFETFPRILETQNRLQMSRVFSEARPRYLFMFDPRKFLNLDQTEHRTIFDNSTNVWDALKQIGSYLQFRLKPAVHGRVLGRPFISENVYIGSGTLIENGATIKGPA